MDDHRTDARASEDRFFDDMLNEQGFPPAPLSLQIERALVWLAIFVGCVAVFVGLAWLITR